MDTMRWLNAQWSVAQAAAIGWQAAKGVSCLLSWCPHTALSRQHVTREGRRRMAHRSTDVAVTTRIGQHLSC
ncbi:hypothetical protein [Streptomyces sp. NPDC000618]|uniref:hypothetical protein n=1 Tax=Streptomyces sp. NPDC000618 TaxID=3154265 RepID=UPI0033236A6F